MELKKFIFQPLTDVIDKTESTEEEINDSLEASTNENLPNSQEVVEEKIEETVTEEVKERTYSESEVTEIKNTAFNDGYHKAITETQNEAQALSTATLVSLESIQNSLTTLYQEIDNKLEETKKELVNLTLVIAKKIAGREIKTDYVSQIEKAIEKAFPAIKDEQTLSLYISKKIEEEVKPKLTDSLSQKFPGKKIIIESDETLSEADCRIIWKNGSMENTRENIIKEIESIFN